MIKSLASKFLKLPKIVYLASIIMSLLFVAIFFSSLDIEGSILTGDKSTRINDNYSRSSIYNFYDSDAIWTVMFCEGILHDKCCKNWNIGTCTNLFPSIIIYMILCLFFKDVLIIQLLHGFIQFFLILILINILYRIVFPRISLYALSIANMALTLFLIWPLYLPDILINTNFFLPYHAGAFINSMLALILMLKYLNTLRTSNLIWFGIIVTFAYFSDSIFLVYFVLPSLLAIIFFIKSDKKKQILTIIVTTILSFLIGWISYWAIIKYNVFSITSPPNSPDNMRQSFDFAFAHFKSFIAIEGPRRYIFGLSYLTIILTICYAIYLSLKQFIHLFSKPDLNWNNFHYFLIFYSILVIGALAAPIYKGIYYFEWSIRYCIFPIFLGLTNIGVICGYYFYNKSQTLLRVFSIACVAALVIYFSMINNQYKPFSIFSRVGNYYSGIVKATDDLSMKYPLKKGVADHWDAKHISELSKKGNKLFTIYHTSLLGWHHGNNIRMLLYTDCNQSDTAFYNYIVLRSLSDTSHICNFFGDNIKRVSQNGYKFYLVPDFYYDPSTGHPVLTERNAFVESKQ